ncbi:MAG: hypothetical protein JNN00_10220 [Chitinophagaceae bacterium]|nr:hypothetical protein [Chitinophagaceae bacterium]
MKPISLFTFLVLTIIIASCKKDSTTAQRTKTEYLTNNTWQVKEIVQQSGNTQGRFVKGGINTTGADYSKARLAFKNDGTGSFTDPLNNTYSLTWSFAPGDETKMTVIVNYSVPATLNYTFITLEENTFIYTIYYTEAGQNALATAQYIPL